jgi:negative regulator of flagellin synthesis FlgM
MRIDAFNKVSQLYSTSSVKNTAKTKSSSFKDLLEISQTGKDYQTARQIVARTPDVREDRVNDIKQQMAAGTYDVSAQEVADKLVDSYFDEMA